MDGVNFPPAKYYDVYKATSGTTISAETACNGGVCYGHALSETAGWRSDVDTLFLQMVRGLNVADSVVMELVLVCFTFIITMVILISITLGGQY